MLKIHIKPLARNNPLGIWPYSLEQWGALQADAYLNQLDSSIRQLSQSPQLGRATDDVREGIMLYPCKRHIILYQIHLESLIVVRVLHERMNIHCHNITVSNIDLYFFHKGDILPEVKVNKITIEYLM